MIKASSFRKEFISTFDLVDTFDPTTLTGVQFMATSAADLSGALTMLEHRAFTTHPHWQNIRAVDLNFGCPSPDVIRIGAGPALLKRKTKLGQIMQALHNWKQTTKLDIRAVGAKIRLGLNKFEQRHQVYLHAADAANENLDYLVVHARHGGQRSRDPPTWEAIGEIVQRASIPIIGNGNVQTLADLKRMYEVSGCSGVMIGRAAMSNPWIFRHLNQVDAPSGTLDAPHLPTAEAGSVWASEPEVKAAKETFDWWSSRHPPKKRVLSWHAQNFERLKEISTSGEEVKMIVPNTYDKMALKAKIAPEVSVA